ncbi:MAG: hypothetical protein ACRC1K_22010, partial [Planctomycetia bacterium]
MPNKTINQLSVAEDFYGDWEFPTWDVGSLDTRKVTATEVSNWIRDVDFGRRSALPNVRPTDKLFINRSGLVYPVTAADVAASILPGSPVLPPAWRGLTPSTFDDEFDDES